MRRRSFSSALALHGRAVRSGAAPARGVSSFLAARGPLLDARSPSEWAAGHVPGALNLPVLTDAHRAAVGAVFAARGRDAAVLHALELVGPSLPALAAEAKRLAGGGGPVRVYCARGGLRSASLAWLLTTLLATPAVSVAPGGYKAYRAWVQSAFARRRPLAVLGGATGCGKTRVLAALASSGAAVVDLEALARHKGSAFGGVGGVRQPTNEQFENDLAQELARADSVGGPLWVEDERRSIGRCYVPAALLAQMEAAPKVLMHAGVEARLWNIAHDYSSAPLNELTDATARISRKLGSERAGHVQEALERGDTAEAAALLLPYYDRTYEHALGRRTADAGPVLEVHAGEEWGAAQWASRLPAIHACWAPVHAAAVGAEGEGAVQNGAWAQELQHAWKAAGSHAVRLTVRDAKMKRR